MRSFKKIVTSITVLCFAYPLTSCQSSSSSLKKNPEKAELIAQSVKGSIFSSTYISESKVIITDKGELTKKYTDTVKFDIERRTLNVNEQGDIQFRTVTSNKTGNMELKDLGYPEPGAEMYEMIDKYGKALVVKDMPIGSIYYISRVALPKEPVTINDTWMYKARWISDDTSWPFEILINSKLKGWSDCEGLMCAVITFTGEVLLPEDFPLKATLKSSIKGEYYYAPISHEILWGISESDEVFDIDPIEKNIKVKSRSCSFKIGYDKKCW